MTKSRIFGILWDTIQCNTGTAAYLVKCLESGSRNPRIPGFFGSFLQFPVRAPRTKNRESSNEEINGVLDILKSRNHRIIIAMIFPNTAADYGPSLLEISSLSADVCFTEPWLMVWIRSGGWLIES